MSGTQPRKILVVDDDDATRRGLCALVTEAGYRAIPAASLQEATEALTREAPDLIITDVRLQGYNGLQLLAMGARPIPAIVVTGFPDRMLEADAHKMGAEYLEKPLSPASLLSLIRVKLDATAPNALFSATRRWTRKPVKRQLKAWVQDFPVRILDISYGGLRHRIGEDARITAAAVALRDAAHLQRGHRRERGVAEAERGNRVAVWSGGARSEPRHLAPAGGRRLVLRNEAGPAARLVRGALLGLWCQPRLALATDSNQPVAQDANHGENDSCRHWFLLDA